MHDRLHLRAAILAQWQRLVASTKALDLLHRAMHAALYRQNGQQSWSIFSLLFCLLLPWRPPGQYGASSCPMAASSGFRVALDMPHQAMPSVLLRRTTLAIKMANNGGAFVCHHQFHH
jgi:hypothetical protein